ncbi:Bromodomain-containing protein 1 [Zea mays]|uniref:Bromodomain-containing protein 1 n=1 Tax=Zea mays TaxID=4577 RepID=A0A3L6E4P6_MAIZE|nr:Bromodomain-containing protein 1 [Zea mays]
MGKQQQAPPARRSPAMSAPPPPKRRKKKGRPSLLDLQKRSLRLEQQQLPQGRRSNRRSAGSADEDDDGPASGSGRREKKLRLVMGLHDGSAKGEKMRKATDGREEPSDSGPTTPLPNKKLLLFILDRLQKKDTYGVFSEPVDPEELPDYHDIIKHPMDFSTIRKKLDKEAYFNLEQFEDDVFLITSNAMCYNSPDTIYYRQARGIQEIAKKDFENLRQDSDASEPEPEPEREPKPEPEPEEPKPQPRRGRPPNKNNAKQKVGKPPAERATADFSGATLATAANIGWHAQADVDLSRRVMDKAMIADVLRASFANLRNEHNWSGERKFERLEAYSGYGGTWSAKTGKRPILMEDSRRSTYYETQPSSSIYELPVSSSYNGTEKLLVPVGVQLPQSYSHSLARFAAQLGPVGWEIASRRLERSLAPGTKFGRGWVGDGETPPNPFQTPVLAAFSETMAPPSSIAASGEQPSMNAPPATEACAGSISHRAGSQPCASISTVQTINSEALASQQCGSVPQVSINRGERAVEMKGSTNNLHGHPAMPQTMNGFNAVPGRVLFPPAAQLVVSQMQTHTAD